MKTKRVIVAKSFSMWYLSFVLIAILGSVGWAGTTPTLGGSETAVTGATGGATAQGANSQLEKCDESLGTMAVVAVFDAICIALMEHTGFTREQFSVIHPHGAVGERLTGKGA